MKVLIIDNYDSFTYNLYQYTGEILEDRGAPFSLDVIRNDEHDYGWIERSSYDRVIISPGPGTPSDPNYFGVCSQVISDLSSDTPVLGVCLGMQGIAHVFGGEIMRAAIPMHGKTSTIEHDGRGVFRGLPDELEVMRYHSLIVNPAALPRELVITAKTLRNTPEEPFEIMGLRHTERPLEGVQFHPESFGTEGGKTMLSNFLFR